MDFLRLALGYGLIFLLPLVIAFWMIIHLGSQFWRRNPPALAYSVALAGLFVCGGFVYFLKDGLLGRALTFSWGLFLLGAFIYLGSLMMARSVRRHLAFRTFAGVPEITGKGSLLIQSGPFGAVRHPRYLMVLVGILGWAVMSHYTGVYAVSLIASIALVFIIKLEEKELIARFGQEYVDYQKQVPMLLPKAANAHLLWKEA